MNQIEIAWDLIGKLGVAIGVIVGIVKGYQFLRSQTSVAKLEEKVKTHETYLAKDKEHLERIDTRLDNMEASMKKEFEMINSSLDILGSSISSIINHMIDGDGIEEMREERKKLTAFFIRKK